MDRLGFDVRPLDVEIGQVGEQVEIIAAEKSAALVLEVGGLGRVVAGHGVGVQVGRRRLDRGNAFLEALQDFGRAGRAPRTRCLWNQDPEQQDGGGALSSLRHPEGHRQSSPRESAA
ncbi:MAG: hypothetical protein ABI609_06065 [Acidobacteriota bacterium]